MTFDDLTPLQRARQAISLVASAAIQSAQAASLVGDVNIVDFSLGVTRGILEAIGKMVPVDVREESLPPDVRKCLRAAEAGRKAINAELGRTIEIATVVPINGLA